MKPEIFQRRAAELRERMSASEPERTFNLAETAQELGVSYSTARRLCNQANVRRYSTTNGAVIFPGSPLKRFQRVRYTYVVTQSDIERIKNQMRGLPLPIAA